jgi:ribosomal protein L16 Arg81 hydroxylase
VVQAHGAKHWTVRAPVIGAPLARHVSERARAEAQPVQFEADLHPGDCLYLPRGFVHSASAQEGSSLHLTIGVRATTAHDVVRHVAALAADDPELRRALPVGWASDAEVATMAVEDAIAGLVRFAGGLDPAEVGARLADRRRRARSSPTTGRLLQLDAVSQLDDSRVVRLPSGRALALATGDDRLRLDLGDRTLDLPATLAPAIERLLDGRSHRVDELADLLDGSSRMVLVRRLVREGCLELLPAGDG